MRVRVPKKCTLWPNQSMGWFHVESAIWEEVDASTRDKLWPNSCSNVAMSTETIRTNSMPTDATRRPQPAGSNTCDAIKYSGAGTAGTAGTAGAV